MAGQWWTGVAIPDIGFTIDQNADHYGELQAWNVNTGKEVWNREHPTSMNWGSVLATAGNLVFMGGTNDRMFRAFDAEYGAVLWKFKTNSGIMAPPVSYEVNGVQYIAVQSGWGVDPAFQQGLINNITGEHRGAPGWRDLGVCATAAVDLQAWPRSSAAPLAAGRAAMQARPGQSLGGGWPALIDGRRVTDAASVPRALGWPR